MTWAWRENVVLGYVTVLTHAQNLDSMLSLAEGLSSQHSQHQRHLDQSKATSEAILGALHRAEDTAGALQNSFMGRWGHFGIWPYVVCPTATLMMGSYGLPPSILRNVGLIAMGTLRYVHNGGTKLTDARIQAS